MAWGLVWAPLHVQQRAEPLGVQPVVRPGSESSWPTVPGRPFSVKREGCCKGSPASGGQEPGVGGATASHALISSPAPTTEPPLGRPDAPHDPLSLTHRTAPRRAKPRGPQPPLRKQLRTILFLSSPQRIVTNFQVPRLPAPSIAPAPVSAIWFPAPRSRLGHPAAFSLSAKDKTLLAPTPAGPPTSLHPRPSPPVPGRLPWPRLQVGPRFVAGPEEGSEYTALPGLAPKHALFREIAHILT